MNQSSYFKWKKIALALVCVAWFLSPVEIWAISQTASDSSAQSSFNTGVNWPSNLAPSAGNAYDTAYLMRTPGTGGNFTFAGDSLTLNSGGQLVYKGAASTDVITVNNLILKTGSTVTSWTTTNNFTLAGNITIASGNTAKFETSGSNYGMTITAVIGGSGTLSFTTSSMVSQAAYATTLNAANTYSGSTTLGNYTYVVAASSGAFGSSNVTVNGGKLTLQSSTAIADSSTLILASTLAVNAVSLSFTGTETVGALSLNGGSTYLSAGTYSVTDLNGYYGSNAFTGTGSIMVIPEPSTWVLVFFGFGLLGVLKITNHLSKFSSKNVV